MRCCPSRRTTTSRTGAASCATSRRSRAPRPARRLSSTTSPAARRSTCRPTCSPSSAQIDGIEAVKQANSAELQPIDGLAVLAGNDDIFARCLDLGEAGGICVASHIVGPEMRRMIDEPERRAEIDASLRDVYETLFLTASPTRTKAALNLLGHDVGTLRLPMVEADEAETAAVRAMLERHGLTSAGSPRPTGARLLSGTLRVLPLGGRRRDRQEHDGRRVRRPHRGGGHGPALPDRRADGHRPRAARLHVPARARRGHRGGGHHPRPRGPPRRAAVDPARARAVRAFPSSTAASSPSRWRAPSWTSTSCARSRWRCFRPASAPTRARSASS